jgi:hypothetical protein
MVDVAFYMWEPVRHKHYEGTNRWTLTFYPIAGRQKRCLVIDRWHFSR